jgi:hypothetical protein
VQLSSKQAGRNNFVIADVEVRDSSGVAAGEVQVTGAWSDASNGAPVGTSSGTTNAAGVATLSLKVSGPGTYAFVVTDVVLAGYEYTPSMNNTELIETEVTIP